MNNARKRPSVLFIAIDEMCPELGCCGIATKKSITRDVKSMKDNGIAGAILIVNGGDYSLTGAFFRSNGCKENFAHGIKETDQLGIEIIRNIQNGAGDIKKPNIEEDNGLKEVAFANKMQQDQRKLRLKWRYLLQIFI